MRSAYRQGMIWVIGVVAVGLARYAMDTLGWSDRAQVLVIVAGIIVAALVVAGVRANREGDAA
jgi:cell division protein FtsW (lipid II flippase)